LSLLVFFLVLARFAAAEPGAEALFAAVNRGDDPAVSTLIARGIEPDVRDEVATSPLAHPSLMRDAT